MRQRGVTRVKKAVTDVMLIRLALEIESVGGYILNKSTTDQLSGAVDAQCLHRVIFVSLHRSPGQLQFRGDLLHGVPGGNLWRSTSRCRGVSLSTDGIAGSLTFLAMLAAIWSVRYTPP